MKQKVDPPPKPADSAQIRPAVLGFCNEKGTTSRTGSQPLDGQHDRRCGVSEGPRTTAEEELFLRIDTPLDGRGPPQPPGRQSLVERRDEVQ